MTVALSCAGGVKPITRKSDQPARFLQPSLVYLCGPGGGDAGVSSYITSATEPHCLSAAEDRRRGESNAGLLSVFQLSESKQSGGAGANGGRSVSGLQSEVRAPWMFGGVRHCAALSDVSLSSRSLRFTQWLCALRPTPKAARSDCFASPCWW